MTGSLLKQVNVLKPYKNNARTHSKEQITKIANSIKTFGFTNPILVDCDDNIIAGHGRLLAAKQLKMVEVPCINLSHLSKDEARAYVIADNRLALDAGWDNELLKMELSELDELGFDLDVIGFSADELDAILNDHEIEDGLIGDDDVPEDVDTRCKLGDVWLLGEHRLMCGDSMAITEVDKLLNGVAVDLVFTDPPYGIDYQDVQHKHKKIENDDDVKNIESLLLITLMQDCPTFICCNWKCYAAFEDAMKKSGKSPKACIVWDKGSRIQNLDKFGKQHEFILYHGPFGGEKTVDVDVWECSRETSTSHPTSKPIELILRALKHFRAKNVLDLFGGSGSTLIACEKSKRKCLMMELSPNYCDVILARWEKFTGQKATLEALDG